MPASAVAVIDTSSTLSILFISVRSSATDAAKFPREPVTPPTTLDPPANGMTATLWLLRPLQHANGLIARPRIDNRIRRIVQLARAQIEQIVVTLAPRMRRPLERAVANIPRADDRRDRIARRAAQPARAKLDVVQFHRRRHRQILRAQRLGDPRPNGIAPFDRIMRLDPTPTVPACLRAIDRHPDQALNFSALGITSNIAGSFPGVSPSTSRNTGSPPVASTGVAMIDVPRNTFTCGLFTCAPV